MKLLVDPHAKTTRKDRATICGTGEQIERWRQKRVQLGLTDAQLLSLVLPTLDEIQEVR